MVLSSKMCLFKKSKLQRELAEKMHRQLNIGQEYENEAIEVVASDQM